jgi:hypothetical protein
MIDGRARADTKDDAVIQVARRRECGASLVVFLIAHAPEKTVPALGRALRWR